MASGLAKSAPVGARTVGRGGHVGVGTADRVGTTAGVGTAAWWGHAADAAKAPKRAMPAAPIQKAATRIQPARVT